MNLDESDSPYELSPFGTPNSANAKVNHANLSDSDSPSTEFDWSDEDYASSITPKGDSMTVKVKIGLGTAEIAEGGVEAVG